MTATGYVSASKRLSSRRKSTREAAAMQIFMRAALEREADMPGTSGRLSAGSVSDPSNRSGLKKEGCSAPAAHSSAQILPSAKFYETALGLPPWWVML